MSYHLDRVQVVPRSLEETFAFFAEPGNLARITPGWLRFRLLDAGGDGMRRGLLLRYRIRPLGLPMRWTTEITTWDPPCRFVDEQVRGPYRRWRHEHTFRAVYGGTEIRDRVEYVLPFGILGRIVHALVVRWQLRAIFHYRERRIREIFS